MMQALFPAPPKPAAPSWATSSRRPLRQTWRGRHRWAAALLGLGLITAAPAALAERGPRNAASTGSAASTSATAASTAQARVIVVYKSERTSALSSTAGEGTAAAVPVRRASTLSQRHGLALSDGLTIASRTQVLFGSGLSSQALKQRLETDTTVEAVYIDERRRPHAAPNDPLYGDNLSTTTPVAGQWYLRAPTSTVLSSINAEAAWAVTPGSSSIVVAVLDTGVRRDHPDLAAKLLPGYDFVSDVATANDGNGRDADPSDPGDWITGAENAAGDFQGCGEAPSSWHGTQTAGLVGAATNNGIGMASIGRNVKILPLRVLGKCGGFDSDIVAAMRWAAGQSVDSLPINPYPARVVSLSLGSAGSCTSLYTSVISSLESLGVSVVVSAGNDARAVNTPANCTNAIAVGGLRHTGTKNGFSSLGTAVTLSAPAGNCVNLSGSCVYPILSTYNAGTRSPGTPAYTSGNDSDYAVGTSFSAPLVAGTIGLMVSANPELTPAQVRDYLKQSARPFPTTTTDATVRQCVAPGAFDQEECLCTTATCGAGMLDAGAALRLTQDNSPVSAFIASSNTVTPGTAVTLDASGAAAPVNSTITSYAWSIKDGGDIATLSTSATDATKATLTPTGIGTVTVELKITTNASSDNVRTSTQQILVSNSTAATGDSASSGGGAASPFWLLGLLLATLGLLFHRQDGCDRS